MKKGLLFSFPEHGNFSEARSFLLVKHLYLYKIGFYVSKDNVISSLFNALTNNTFLQTLLYSCRKANYVHFLKEVMSDFVHIKCAFHVNI